MGFFNMSKLHKVVFASSNKGKMVEFKSALQNHVKEIHLQSDFNIPDIPETGTTFIENAILKAKNACKYTNLFAFADDSGLMIDALNGEPGIYSARYAGNAPSFKDHINKVLNNLKDVEPEKRTAFFYSVIVLVEHIDDPMPKIFEGIWAGKILESPQGENGFGYDPIFYDLTYKCSAANLSTEVKNKISARGQALKKLIDYLDGTKYQDINCNINIEKHLTSKNSNFS